MNLKNPKLLTAKPRVNANTRSPDFGNFRAPVDQECSWLSFEEYKECNKSWIKKKQENRDKKTQKNMSSQAKYTWICSFYLLFFIFFSGFLVFRVRQSGFLRPIFVHPFFRAVHHHYHVHHLYYHHRWSTYYKSKFWRILAIFLCFKLKSKCLVKKVGDGTKNPVDMESENDNVDGESMLIDIRIQMDVVEKYESMKNGHHVPPVDTIIKMMDQNSILTIEKWLNEVPFLLFPRNGKRNISRWYYITVISNNFIAEVKYM